jgi:hypothetical protein
MANHVPPEFTARRMSSSWSQSEDGPSRCGGSHPAHAIES